MVSHTKEQVWNKWKLNNKNLTHILKRCFLREREREGERKEGARRRRTTQCDVWRRTDFYTGRFTDLIYGLPNSSKKEGQIYLKDKVTCLVRQKSFVGQQRRNSCCCKRKWGAINIHLHLIIWFCWGSKTRFWIRVLNSFE